MKSSIILILLVILTAAFPVSFGADSEVSKISEKLMRLEQLIGEWDGVLKDDSGKDMKAKGVIEPCAVGEKGANAVTARFILPNGSALGFQFRIWYFDPENNRLTALLISENGGAVKYVATKDGNEKGKITSMVSFVEADGSRGTAVEELTWTDKDHFVLHSTENIVDGKPGSAYRVEFTRVKKQ
jgi:hypothetical protein